MYEEYRILMTCGKHQGEKGTAKREINRYTVGIQLDTGRWISAKLNEFDVIKPGSESDPNQESGWSVGSTTSTSSDSATQSQDNGTATMRILHSEKAVWTVIGLGLSVFLLVAFLSNGREPSKDCQSVSECTSRLNWANEKKVPMIEKRDGLKKQVEAIDKQLSVMDASAKDALDRINTFRK